MDGSGIRGMIHSLLAYICMGNPFSLPWFSALLKSGVVSCLAFLLSFSWSVVFSVLFPFCPFFHRCSALVVVGFRPAACKLTTGAQRGGGIRNSFDRSIKTHVVQTLVIDRASSVMHPSSHFAFIFHLSSSFLFFIVALVIILIILVAD